MRVLIGFLFFLSISSYAKQIFIEFLDNNHKNNNTQISELVDSKLHVWKFINFIFKYLNIDKNLYTLAQESPNGYDELEINKRLRDYGDSARSSVKFYIIPKQWIFLP